MINPNILNMEVIAYPEDFNSVRKDTRVIGVFNPGVTTISTDKGLETLVMFRIAEAPIKDLDNCVFVPRWDYQNLNKNGKTPLVLDKIKKDFILKLSKKEVGYSHETGKKITRLRHISRFAVGVLDDSGSFNEFNTNLKLNHRFEEFGIEDPRITKFEKEAVEIVGNNYGITYTIPHNLDGVSTLILLTDDFKKFEWFPKGNTARPVVSGKDTIIFPGLYESPDIDIRTGKKEKEFVVARRPSEHSGIRDPTICVEYSPNLARFGVPHRLIEQQNGNVIGAGSSPIKVNENLLMAYHEAIKYCHKDAEKFGHSHYYVTKLIKLNCNNPWERFANSGVFLERKDFNDILPDLGFVPNVVYTTGMILKGDKIEMYHGIDDTWTAKTTHNIDDVLYYKGA